MPPNPTTKEAELLRQFAGEPFPARATPEKQGTSNADNFEYVYPVRLPYRLEDFKRHPEGLAVDIGMLLAGQSTEIQAVTSGVVTMFQNQSGTSINLAGDDGMNYLYHHLPSAIMGQFSQGERVEVGASFGGPALEEDAAGHGDQWTDPHLHFAVSSKPFKGKNYLGNVLVDHFFDAALEGLSTRFTNSGSLGNISTRVKEAQLEGGAVFEGGEVSAPGKKINVRTTGAGRIIPWEVVKRARLRINQLEGEQAVRRARIDELKGKGAGGGGGGLDNPITAGLIKRAVESGQAGFPEINAAAGEPEEVDPALDEELFRLGREFETTEAEIVLLLDKEDEYGKRHNNYVKSQPSLALELNEFATQDQVQFAKTIGAAANDARNFTSRPLSEIRKQRDDAMEAAGLTSLIQGPTVPGGGSGSLAAIRNAATNAARLEFDKEKFGSLSAFQEEEVRLREAALAVEKRGQNRRAFDDALRAYINLQPFTLPTGATHFPGFEPGGPVETFRRAAGQPFVPSRAPAPQIVNVGALAQSMLSGQR